MGARKNKRFPHFKLLHFKLTKLWLTNCCLGDMMGVVLKERSNLVMKQKETIGNEKFYFYYGCLGYFYSVGSFCCDTF